MRVIPLQLVRCHRPQRAATAWFISGADLEMWLTEIAHWPVKHEDLRCLVMPRSDTTTIVDGVLVLLKEPLPETFIPNGCLPYGLITKNLYGPVEAAVMPPLTDEEWPTVLADPERVMVWRATGDFIGFELQDVLSLVDLLTGHIASGINWHAAREVPSFAARLRSIASSAPVLTVEDIATQWDQEIGPKQPPQSIPPQPGETPPGWTERLITATAGFRRRLSSIWKSIRERLAPYRDYIFAAVGVLLALALVSVLISLPQSGGLSWWSFLPILLFMLLMAALLRGHGHTDGGATQGSLTSGTALPGTGGFWSWLRGRFSSARSGGFSLNPFQGADQRQREREVQRLLRMLNDNPDEGLRYAIPFGGSAGRGTAPAGNQLVARDLNFGFGGGGGSADYWNISPAQQLRLIESYRTLAERELRAGRHRRAAYIYSQLLDDWRSAANALAAGHHHAEAAVIYEKRLHNIAAAAQQYELAGQPETALKLYAEISDWIAAAELCQRLERQEDAREYYRLAVDAALRSGNVPRAAELLEGKLGEVDEAFDRLEQAWPSATCADQCFDAWFDLAGRHHRTDAALTRIEQLTDRTSQEDALRLMPRLLRLHQRYPQAEVQQQARDASFQLIGRHLAEAPPQLSSSLTAFLPALTPSDRLLARDCQRYVESCRIPITPSSRTLNEAPQLRCRHTFSLSDAPLANPVFATKHGWVVLTERTAEQPQELVLSSWEKKVGVLAFGRLPFHTTLVAVIDRTHEIWMSTARSMTQVQRVLDGRGWDILSPPWLPGHTIRVLPFSGMTRVLWFDDFGAAWLSNFQHNGTNVRSVRVAEEWLSHPEIATRLLRGKAQLYERTEGAVLVCLPVGDGTILGELFDDQQVRVWSGLLQGEDIVCSPDPSSRAAILLGHDYVVLADDVCLTTEHVRLHLGWNAPRATFLHGNLILLVDDQRVAIYRWDNPTPLAEFNYLGGVPLAVASSGPAEVSVLRNHGMVEKWTF